LTISKVMVCSTSRESETWLGCFAIFFVSAPAGRSALENDRFLPLERLLTKPVFLCTCFPF
jgi:hypothetical protein